MGNDNSIRVLTSPQWQVHTEHANMVKGSTSSVHNEFHEARISQPSSPSLQDAHKLYRYDKEKSARDKARMQQRRSHEDLRNVDTHVNQPVLRKDRSNRGSAESSPSGDRKQDRKGKEKITKNWVDGDDGGFSQHRSSADSESMTADSSSVKHHSPKLLAKSQSYYSIMEKGMDPVYYHHTTQKSHTRHRRGREYDSDAGSKSDQELNRLRRQQTCGSRDGNYSDIDQFSSRGRRQEYGYNSDMEMYSRGRGTHHGRVGGYSSDVDAYQSKYRHSRSDTASDVNDYTSKNRQNNSYFKKPLQTQFNPRTIPFKRSSGSNNYSVLKTDKNDVIRNDELYDHTGRSRTLPGNQSDHTPSPSAFHRSKIVDQSTPIPTGSPQSFHRPTKNINDSDDNWKNELFSASKQLQKAQRDSNNKSQPAVRRDNIPLSIDPHTPGPPPYNPAPPYDNLQTNELSNLDSADKSFQQLHVDVSNLPKSAQNSFYKNNVDQSKNVWNRSDKSNSVINPNSESRNRNSEYDSVHKYNLHDRSIYIDPYQPTGSQKSKSQTTRNDLRYNDNYSSQKPTGNSSNYSSGNYEHFKGSYHNYQDYKHISCDSNGRGSLDVSSNKGNRTEQQNRRYGSSMASTGNKNNEQNRSSSGFPDKSLLLNYEAANSDPASQVSSSTDSGYGHSHHMYDRNLEKSTKYSGSYSLHNSQKSPNNSFSSSPIRELHSASQSREATPIRSTEQHTKDHEASLEKNYAKQKKTDIFRVRISKNPGLGFSIAGGIGSHGNPFQPNDLGIFVTKIQPNGPASTSVLPGDKLLEVNGIDFTNIEHIQAVSVMKNCSKVSLLIERMLS